MRRLLAALLLLVVAGCSTTGVSGEATPQPEPTVPSFAALPQPVEDPVRIDIPALGVSEDIVRVGIDAERRMEIPPVDQVGFYVHSVVPGAIGPSVLAGHRNWDGTPGAFLRIGELKPGDTIIITGASGEQATFTVYETRSFPKSTFDYGFVFSDRDTPDLILVTCSGGVVDRHYTDNTAVAARLAVDR